MKRRKGKQAMPPALKRWYCAAVFWPLLCFIFAGAVIGQADRTLDERVGDTIFILFPLIFFAIGMFIRRRLLTERSAATALTTAAVVSEGRRNRAGGKKSCFPVFAFEANGRKYEVTAQSGSGFRTVKEGEQVDLYYMPENPQLFYVPVLQKYDNRCCRLFCGIGVLFPLAGLFAPQIRAVLSFLP